MSKELTKRQLPTVNDLYGESVVLSKQNDLNQLLNNEPKTEWVKQHPMFAKVKYLPIERVEWLLTNIYIKWRVEIIREGLIANSVYCTIRLHYKDPITGEWEYQDGIGSAPLQTDKDSGATDWQHIKSDAVLKALPSAESYAVKDAAEKLGKLFGKDMNRADKIMYDTLQGKFENTYEKKVRELIDIIDKLPEPRKSAHKEILQRKQKEKSLSEPDVDEMLEQLR